MSHNVICDGCQEEKHEDYVEWRVCERCISQCNGQAADKLERLRAERDRAIREKNGLFDALRDKKPTTVNVQVASTGQQETIDKQAQRIAELEAQVERFRCRTDKFLDRIASLEDEIALTKELHAAILDLIGSEGMTDAKFVRWVETAIAKEQDDG